MSKEINVEFAVMTDTGEKPDSAIFVAAFDDGESLGNHVKFEGNLRHQAMMTNAVVEGMIKSLHEEQGVVGVAALVASICDTLVRCAGDKAMKIAAMMTDPEKVAQAIGVVFDEMAEDGADDAEPV